MHFTKKWIGLLIFMSAGVSVEIPAVAAEGEVPSGCAPSGTMLTRTTLYFGLARPAGTIKERHWKEFVRKEVMRRFPQGFTVWEADGQWLRADGRISRERAKVLLVVHANSPAIREALIALVETYKKAFQQESVLWETANVCAAF